MTRIIGVRFRHSGKMYYFDPADFPVRYDDAVIVDTARGLEYGRVVIAPVSLEDEKIKQPLKPIVRMATEEDTAREEEHEKRETEAFIICREKILERNLEMKLIGAEYAFDDSKLLFYFTADGRIDFRELVKDLAGIFRRRIELRQIGVRDETKLLGGIGTCGRPLCCHTYLSDFAPVSIKMAKEQNLSLNPAKISGTCGRLMCCLNNEAETYAELKKNLPGKGDQATTPDGRHGEVHSVNILRQLVKVIVDMDGDEKELKEYHISEITFIPHSKRPKPQQQKKKTDADAAEQGQELPVTEEQRKYRQAIKKALENQKSENEDTAESNDPSVHGRIGRNRNRSRNHDRNRTENQTEGRSSESLRNEASGSEEAHEGKERHSERRRQPRNAARQGRGPETHQETATAPGQHSEGEKAGSPEAPKHHRPRHRRSPGAQSGEKTEHSTESSREQ